MLSIDKLKSELTYDPATGVFYRNDSNDQITGMIVINQTRYSARRLAWLYMTGTMPCSPVYTINGNPCDLRWTNLTCNQADAHRAHYSPVLRRDNKSGVTGVSYNRRDKRWVAQIMTNGVNRFLGSSKSKQKVIKIRRDFEHKTMFL